MRRFLRYLRIAFSVACGVACLWLIASWARSFQQPRMFILSRHAVVFTSGDIRVDRRSKTYIVPSGHWQTKPGDDISTLWKMKEIPVEHVTGGISLPFWLATLLLLALGSLPWFSWHFSLRTMLVVTTLVAFVLGFIVWASR
jgi:hypothetical protein